jgi:O-methyltransferase
MADNFFIVRDFDWEVRRSSHLDRGLNLLAKRLGRRANTAGVIDRAIRGVTGLTFAATRSGVSTNVEQRMNMYHLVSQTLAYKVEGDLVEVGCNEGQSSVLIAKVMRSFNSDKKLHVYDSFEGLPATKLVDGDSYKQGDLATSEDVLRSHFSRNGLELPTIHKGWFDKTLPTGLPEKISFAYLDGDLYDSIMISLRHVYPRLSTGAICLIDDYCDTAINPDGWNHLPGVKRACDEFLKDKPEEICYVYSGSFTHGFFRKL